MASQPFKIWSRDRCIKKSVTASTLEQLLVKAKEKLHIASGDNVRLVLEEDGTEVDDDEYLAFLPNNTTLQVVAIDEEWLPDKKAGDGTDELDSASIGEGDKQTKLVKSLRTDLTRIVAFSNDDLQLIANMDSETLARELHDSLEHAKCIQTTCRGHLDSQDRTNEAMDLLNLYHKSQAAGPGGDAASDAKRRKLP